MRHPEWKGEEGASNEPGTRSPKMTGSPAGNSVINGKHLPMLPVPGNY